MASKNAGFSEAFLKPNLDRPFGLHLWPRFSQGFEFVTGYPASEFEFVVAKTPMSTLKQTSTVIAAYYTTIFLGRKIMQHREAFKMKSLFLVHNLYLTAISALLLALFAEELIPTLVRKGVFYAICDPDGGWTQHLVVLYYVNWFLLT